MAVKPLLGSEKPRIFTPPLRRLTRKTSAGFDFCDFATDVLGLDLIPWQRWLAIHLLELRPEGGLRFRTVIILVARQNGKSTFLQMLSLYFMYVQGVRLVLGTAQDLDVAEEVWQGAVDIAEGCDELAGEVKKVSQTNGKRFLELHGGEKYKVKAANRSAGRGLSGDLVLLDELREQRNWLAWAAVTKTTMAREFALIVGASNAGDVSSVVLAFYRRMAHAALGDPDGIVGDSAVGELPDDVEPDDSVALFEYSAPPDCDKHDRQAWAQANPSMGYTIAERTIAAAAHEPDEVFRTEVLCQWVDNMTPDSEDEINPTTWAWCADDEAAPVAELALAVDVSPGLVSAAIGVVGTSADGYPVCEVIEHRRGTDWLFERLPEVCKAQGVRQVVRDPSGPAGGMLAELNEIAGVDWVDLDGKDVQRSGTALTGAVTTREFKHRADEALDSAVAGIKARKAGDGLKWSRVDSTVDISPFMAINFAHWAWASNPDYDVEDSIY